jgi:hypothetical protein
MKIYTVFAAADKDRFHAWALSSQLGTHYRSMSNGNFLAIAEGSIRHEDELVAMGFALLPPLEEPETLVRAEVVAMFPAELGIVATHNTYHAMKAYSDKTGTRTFHPRR